MSALAAIHVARKQLGLDDDTARDLYARVTGKRSLREMSPAEQDRIVAELRRRGFAREENVPSKPPSQRIQGPYAKKLQALWIAMWHLGLTRDRTDEGLATFVRKQTKVDHTRFLIDPAEAKKAIEALKGWMAREAGVEWTPSRSPDWLRHDAAKVAWAQWKALHPEVGPAFAAFVGGVQDALGRPERLAACTLDALTIRDWQQVNKAWGAEVRRRSRP